MDKVKITQKQAEILTEELINMVEADNDGNNFETVVIQKLIASHRNLLSANAELSFKKEIFKRAVEDIIVAVDFMDAETVRALAFKALEDAK